MGSLPTDVLGCCAAPLMVDGDKEAKTGAVPLAALPDSGTSEKNALDDVIGRLMSTEEEERRVLEQNWRLVVETKLANVLLFADAATVAESARVALRNLEGVPPLALGHFTLEGTSPALLKCRACGHEGWFGVEWRRRCRLCGFLVAPPPPSAAHLMPMRGYIESPVSYVSLPVGVTHICPTTLATAGPIRSDPAGGGGLWRVEVRDDGTVQFRAFRDPAVGPKFGVTGVHHAESTGTEDVVLACAEGVAYDVALGSTHVFFGAVKMPARCVVFLSGNPKPPTLTQLSNSDLAAAWGEACRRAVSAPCSPIIFPLLPPPPAKPGKARRVLFADEVATAPAAHPMTATAPQPAPTPAASPASPRRLASSAPASPSHATTSALRATPAPADAPMAELVAVASAVLSFAGDAREGGGAMGRALRAGKLDGPLAALCAAAERAAPFCDAAVYALAAATAVDPLAFPPLPTEARLAMERTRAALPPELARACGALWREIVKSRFETGPLAELCGLVTRGSLFTELPPSRSPPPPPPASAAGAASASDPAPAAAWASPTLARVWARLAMLGVAGGVSAGRLAVAAAYAGVRARLEALHMSPTPHPPCPPPPGGVENVLRHLLRPPPLAGGDVCFGACCSVAAWGAEVPAGVALREFSLEDASHLAGGCSPDGLMASWGVRRGAAADGGGLVYAGTWAGGIPSGCGVMEVAPCGVYVGAIRDGVRAGGCGAHFPPREQEAPSSGGALCLLGVWDADQPREGARILMSDGSLRLPAGQR